MVTCSEQTHSNTLNDVPSCKSHSFLRFGSDHSVAWAAPDSEIPGVDTDAEDVPGAGSGLVPVMPMLGIWGFRFYPSHWKGPRSGWVVGCARKQYGYRP